MAQMKVPVETRSGRRAESMLLLKRVLVVSQIRGPQYRPQNTIVLITGTPKKVPLNFGKHPCCCSK